VRPKKDNNNTTTGTTMAQTKKKRALPPQCEHQVPTTNHKKHKAGDDDDDVGGFDRLRRFFEVKTISDILAEKEKKTMKNKTETKDSKGEAIISLDEDLTVAQALQILHNNTISSAPVYANTRMPNGDVSKDFRGFLDAGVVLSRLCKECKLTERPEDIAITPDGQLQNPEEILKEGIRKFWKRKVKDVCGMDATLIPKILANINIKGLMTEMLFDRRKIPIHRVAIFSEKTITSIVSQSDVIRFVDAHAEELGEALSHTIQHIGLYDPKSGVETISSQMLALEAFDHMFSKNLSSLGIVDEEGKLVGNLSVSDLQGLHANYMAAAATLALRILEFLKIKTYLQKTAPVEINESLPELRAIAVRKEITLRELLALISKKRVHRAYVIDATSKPIGVITLTDIIRMFCEKCAVELE